MSVKRALFMHMAILLLAVLLPSCSFESQQETPFPTATATAATPTPSAVPPTQSPTPPPLTLVPVTPDEPLATRTPVCGDSTLSTRLILNARGQVSDEDMRPLNVRAGPGTEFRILGRLEVLDTFYVLEGPVCGTPYPWYRVESDDLTGWIAEGDFSQYYVEPYFPG